MILRELAPGTRVAEPDLSGLRKAVVAAAIALFAANIVDTLISGLCVVGLGALEIHPTMAPLIGTPWAAGLKYAIPMIVVVLATRVVSRRAVLALWCATGLHVLIAASSPGQLLHVLLVLLPQIVVGLLARTAPASHGGRGTARLDARLRVQPKLGRWRAGVVYSA